VYSIEHYYHSSLQNTSGLIHIFYSVAEQPANRHVGNFWVARGFLDKNKAQIWVPCDKVSTEKRNKVTVCNIANCGVFANIMGSEL